MLALLVILGIAALSLGRSVAQRAQPIAEVETESTNVQFILSDRAVAIWALVCLAAIVPIGVTALRLLLR